MPSQKTTSRPPAHPTDQRPEPGPPFPAQHQPHPGRESDIDPKPRYEAPNYKPAGKLTGKIALITGGDSGIGRAVALIYAREGADVAIAFLPSEQEDAEEVRAAVTATGRRCLLLADDLTNAGAAENLIEQTVSQLGGLDILVSNAAYQNRKETLADIDDAEFDKTYRTNVHAFFRLAKAAIPHLREGSAIIVTASIQGKQPSAELVDYASTKAALISMTKSLAKQLVSKGIRVNAVAPGPVWTPLNAVDAGQPAEKVGTFGTDSESGRPAQPEEIAPAYVFLASNPDSSYISGAVIFPTLAE